MSIAYPSTANWEREFRHVFLLHNDPDGEKMREFIEDLLCRRGAEKAHQIINYLETELPNDEQRTHRITAKIRQNAEK